MFDEPNPEWLEFVTHIRCNGGTKMSEDRLTTLLGICIVPAILTELGVTDDNYAEELEKFYASKLFAILSDKETALWHLSPATLAQMYNDEVETGSFEIPEEQS